MNELLKFSHDRDADFRKSCNDLQSRIDAFVENPMLDDWYIHFEDNYFLPRDIVKQQMKVFLSRKYDYRGCSFHKVLLPLERFKLAIKHTLYLLFVLFFSRSYPGKIKSFNLIAHCISKIDCDRLFSLMALFGRENVLIITDKNMNMPEHKILYQPKHKLCDRKETSRVIFNEIAKGLTLYLFLSNKAGINLVPIANDIVKRYLYAYTVFKYNRSKYYVEQRQYETSAVRNHIFRKYGGAYACCTQTNIQQLGINGFYFDMDVFFAFGKKSADWVHEYGARIDHVVPVGSTAMECYYFKRNIKRSRNCKYDIIYFTIKAPMAFHIMDAYSSFMDDYYSSFQWLAEYSKKNPHLRIGIKHHPTFIFDERERKITDGSSIDYIDQTLNSYEFAFQTKCAVTFGSTMGHELLGHNIHLLYMDPGCRNVFLPDKDDSLLGPYRVTDYDDFSQKLHILLSGQSLEGASNIDKADFCLESNKVCERIYSWFLSSTGNPQ